MNNLNMFNEEVIKEGLSMIRKYRNPKKYKHNKNKILKQISMMRKWYNLFIEHNKYYITEKYR